MEIKNTDINEVLIIEPDVFEDNRGFFTEIYHHPRYAAFLGGRAFIQDNLSFSYKHVLRGLHFQIKHPQAKLIQVLSGEIFDVAVDIRKDSFGFGKWTGVTLSEENKRQLFIPEGFAHGFCVMSKTALVLYKCTDLYDPEYDKGILCSDPDIGINWPVENPILSEKDKNLPYLNQIEAEL